jgi:uncharacterized protein YjiS (DUF1127 family)
MNYGDYTRYRVPFAALVEPTCFGGEAGYDASEALVRAFSRIVATIARRFKSRAMVKQLSALSDQVLKDIGIERGEIDLLVRRAAENPDVDYRVLRSW